MYRLFVAISLLYISSSGVQILPRPRSALKGRVIGGEDADIENYPYQLSLEYKGIHNCGAVIISKDWAVTSAHCVDEYEVNNIRFRAGSSIREEGGTLHPASQIIMNPTYDYFTIDNDIAVAKVSIPFTYGPGVQPISMITKEPAGGEIGTITGWGSTTPDGPGSSQLQVLSLPIVDHQQCNRDYYEYGGISANMICAGFEEGKKDACQTDSGGPLVVGGKLAGLISWGVSCAEAGLPGVYANVATLRSFVTFYTGIQ